jgi:hypothetical protein
LVQPVGNPFVLSVLKLIRHIGYGYVQVNPVNEHIQGDQWWTDYQITSYKLQSKRGSQAQYKNMVDTCHAAGVKVIAGAFLLRDDPTTSFIAGVDQMSFLGRCRLQPHGWL